MSRPVKKKAKPVKKSARKKAIKKAFSQREQEISEREIKRSLAVLDERTDERYDYAKLIYEMQSPKVKAIIEAMVDKMHVMVGDNPPLYYKGTPINGGDPQTVRKLYDKNFYWLAIRILVSLALWDIRMEDFKLSPKLCARCGEKA